MDTDHDMLNLQEPFMRDLLLDPPPFEFSKLQISDRKEVEDESMWEDLILASPGNSSYTPTEEEIKRIAETEREWEEGEKACFCVFTGVYKHAQGISSNYLSNPI